MTAMASLTRVGCGGPHTAHTAAETTKVKDLELIFRSVTLTQ